MSFRPGSDSVSEHQDKGVEEEAGRKRRREKREEFLKWGEMFFKSVDVEERMLKYYFV